MTRYYLSLFLACLLFVAAPVAGNAAQGDCGQPLSTGTSPTAGDCLFILKTAVGSQVCEPICMCDTTGAGGATAADALLCLKKAVGQNVTLTCPTPCGTVTTSTSTTSSSTSSSTSTSTGPTTTSTVTGLQAGDTPDQRIETAAAPATSTLRSRAPGADGVPRASLLDAIPVAASVPAQMCSVEL